MRCLWGVVLAAAAVACCPGSPDVSTPSSLAAEVDVTSPHPVTPKGGPPKGAAWRAARDELAALRARFAPRRARTHHVKLVMEHGPSGRRLEARGAVAVGRTDGLRMILLGPGGTTALDLWICGDDFRYRVPALDMERRGRIVGEQDTGLPVGFLRWWFLDRLRGRLLSYDEDDEGTRRFLLRHGGDVLAVRGGDRLRVDRGEETLSAEGGDCGHARYRHERLGLTIEVDCERVDEGAPPPRAFADPDDAGRGCAASEDDA